MEVKLNKSYNYLTGNMFEKIKKSGTKLVKATCTMKISNYLIALVSISVMVTCIATADTPVQSLPPVNVNDTAAKDVIQESAPVGPYNQPEWTTARRFPTTRVYLQQPPWGVGVEQWVKTQWSRGESANYLFQEEIEIGLPWRLQADLYENWRINEHHNVYHESVQAELRWALADWGKIWGNPTLYGEWAFVDKDRGPDKYEFKLLLGDEITPRLHWGFNAIYEQEVGGKRATEIAVSLGLSYTLVDEKLSAGLELKVESATEKGARHNAPIEVDLGPSMQWRPTHNTHLDVVPLVGLTSDSPHVELWVIFGVDFGPGHSGGGHAPVSLKSQ